MASGQQERLVVFGNDYPTKDGTGAPHPPLIFIRRQCLLAVRDYVHVMDIARGHVAALDKITEASGASFLSLLDSPFTLV